MYISCILYLAPCFLFPYACYCKYLTKEYDGQPFYLSE